MPIAPGLHVKVATRFQPHDHKQHRGSIEYVGGEGGCMERRSRLYSLFSINKKSFIRLLINHFFILTNDLLILINDF